jgi:putative toxin-antitoxin system antitoxin component (TIGR02293 family)
MLQQSAAFSNAHVIRLMAPGVRASQKDSNADCHRMIERGFPVRFADTVKAALSVNDDVMSGLLVISEKTLSRLRAARGTLDPAVSDRLFRTAKIAALAFFVMESREAGAAWLKRPQIGLGGETPISLLTTAAGTEEVERLLLRIEHGVYS